ncbi:MAG: PKD domain-containing protein [Frankiaceae bacterium]|nr:PKD domain-containing protein [Frankiaceae bacterium]
MKQQRKPSDRVPGRGTANDGEAPGKITWTKTEEYITSMCSGNDLHGADVMCMQAATYCADGRVGFWIWHQVTTFTKDTDGVITKDVGTWIQEGGAYCLGADDPGVPTIGKVVSWVQDNFSTIGIAPAAVKAAPAPRTLVNIETKLSAGSGAVVDIPAATPWAQVVIHATPLRYRWYFGDGTPPLTTTVPDVAHVYTRAALLSAVHVDVEWGGTFSAVGDPTAYPIVGTALVVGDSITVDVREARAQLVSR